MKASFLLEATDRNFQQLIQGNSHKGLVLVDFWSPGVGPCLRQRSVLQQLAEDARGRWLLATADVSSQPAIRDYFAITSVPTCKLVRLGRVVETLHGAHGRASYLEAIERQQPKLADAALVEVVKRWRQGQQECALQDLAEAIVAQPADPSRPALMLRLLMQAGRIEQAVEVWRAIPETLKGSKDLRQLGTHLDFIAAAGDSQPEQLRQGLQQRPDDHPARFALAAHELLADRYENAISELLIILQRNPSALEGRVRQALSGLFDWLGKDHPLVQRYRRQAFQLKY